MEVNKKQLADIFGASIRTIQNWQEQGMPVLRGGGRDEVLYDSAAVIKWYAERDAEIENEAAPGSPDRAGAARQISSQGRSSTNAIDLRAPGRRIGSLKMPETLLSGGNRICTLCCRGSQVKLPVLMGSPSA